MSKYCPKCGTEISSTETFCNRCRSRLADGAHKHCGNCGTEFVGASAYCGNCGSMRSTSGPIFEKDVNAKRNARSTAIFMGILGIVGVLAFFLPWGSMTTFITESTVTYTGWDLITNKDFLGIRDFGGQIYAVLSLLFFIVAPLTMFMSKTPAKILGFVASIGALVFVALTINEFLSMQVVIYEVIVYKASLGIALPVLGVVSIISAITALVYKGNIWTGKN